MSEATTRVTIIRYLDPSGERTVELPGWGNSVKGLADALSEGRVVDLNLTLGQLWIERPYAKHEEAPNELTAVDLRSVDGKQRMIQEFAGHLTDRAALGELIAQRLGDGAARWMPVAVEHLRRTSSSPSPRMMAERCRVAIEEILASTHRAHSFDWSCPPNALGRRQGAYSEEFFLEFRCSASFAGLLDAERARFAADLHQEATCPTRGHSEEWALVSLHKSLLGAVLRRAAQKLAADDAVIDAADSYVNGTGP